MAAKLPPKKAMYFIMAAKYNLHPHCCYLPSQTDISFEVIVHLQSPNHFKTQGCKLSMAVDRPLTVLRRFRVSHDQYHMTQTQL